MKIEEKPVGNYKASSKLQAHNKLKQGQYTSVYQQNTLNYKLI